MDPLALLGYEMTPSNDARVKSESYRSTAAHGPLGIEQAHGEQNPLRTEEPPHSVRRGPFPRRAKTQ